MPGLRPDLLGGNALAADARGPAGPLRDVLRRLVAGELSEDDALSEIRRMQLDELGGRARLDLGRYMRRGVPEVVLAQGKSPEEAATLVVAMARDQGQGLISRMSPAHEAALRAASAAAGMEVVLGHASARVLRAGFTDDVTGGKVGILTAGTSDVPVAEEARMVAVACGCETRLAASLGVAGLHRFGGPLAATLEWGADVIVVAAGMDGVLPGLVAGLVDAPGIGLPVSTGYGHGGAGGGGGRAAALIASRAAQGRRRGRSTATTAKTTAPMSSSPKTTPAIARDRSAPPGTAKRTARPRTAAKMPTSSHGKPRRRRAEKRIPRAPGRFFAGFWGSFTAVTAAPPAT